MCLFSGLSSGSPPLQIEPALMGFDLVHAGGMFFSPRESPATRTASSRTAYRSRRRFLLWVAGLMFLLLEAERILLYYKTMKGTQSQKVITGSLTPICSIPPAPIRITKRISFSSGVIPWKMHLAAGGDRTARAGKVPCRRLSIGRFE